MVIVKASRNCEAGVEPSGQFLAEMDKYNEALAKAGILLEMVRLHPSSKGARVRFSGTERAVIDGPFAETKEIIGGFWVWQVRSKEEAIDWVKRCPLPHNEGGEIEIREVVEAPELAQNDEILRKDTGLRAKRAKR